MGKVALITGGASGMGLVVAKHLAAKNQGWQLVLLDLNDQAGAAAVSEVPNSVFVEVDVTSWASLASAFDTTFEKFGRIDFVFANAGIVERDIFYQDHTVGVTGPNNRMPPPPNSSTIAVNLTGVVMTAHLALHYFRLSPHKGKDASLVMTASVGGLYPSQFSPIYSATKSGVVNFMRSIAFPFHNDDGIRVYATCPGTVRTNLLNPKEWEAFPEEFFTPVESIASTVGMLVEGGDMTDAWGRKVPAGKDYGLAVEISGKNFYFRDQPEYCDDSMRHVMEATSMENQLASFKKRNGAMGRA